jgi:FAD synthase
MGRVWIYIIGRELNDEELQQLQQAGIDFVTGWTAHENKLSGSFEIFAKRIIVVKVNEKVYEASGCSIDKLTRFIKEIEARFSVELMNRLLVAVKENDGVMIFSSSDIKKMLAEGKLSENTIVYNTSASNSEELAHWEKPLKDTWLSKFLQKA